MRVGINFQEKFLPLRSPEDGTGSAASQAPASPSSGSGGADGAAPAQSAHDTGGAASSTPERIEPSRVSNETTDDRPQADFNLDGFNDVYLDEIEIPAGTATGQSPPNAQAQEQKEQKQVVPPAASPPVAPQAAAPQAPPATQGQQGQQAAPSPAQDSPQEVLRNLEHPETAKTIRNWLSQNLYALSEEERNALDTDAVGAIPGLLSRVHLESAKNTMSLIQSLVPKMVQEGVQNALQGQKKAGEAMSEFFAAWPGLNQREHGQLVDQFAKMFRSANPKASRQDAIKFVGAAIHAHLGLMPQQRQANGTQPARAQPFAPARPGARPPAAQVVDADPWAGLDQNYDDD